MKENDTASNLARPERVVVTRIFGGPAERVFDAWLDAAAVGGWLFATPGGEMQRVEVDGREGGKFVIVEKRGQMPAEHFGTYTVLERPRKLVFTFATNKVDQAAVVTVGIEPGAAGCKLTLTHELGPEWIAYREKLVAGWTMILEGLAARIFGERDFVITRLLDAPRGKVWQAWTVPGQMGWWGPKGVTIHHAKIDLRPGGTFHYAMRTPDGREMWGRWVLREVVPPGRLVFVNSFSDEAGGVTRHPMVPTWPLELLSTITFAEQEGKTLLTVRWQPLNATEEERKTFDQSHDDMNGGWGGSLDRLVEQLAKT
jgi:uncharacterized protein YndB with AHSA1/START domain